MDDNFVRVTVTVMKYHGHKQVGKERVYFYLPYSSILLYITEGI